jgi:hypothetical protein
MRGMAFFHRPLGLRDEIRCRAPVSRASWPAAQSSIFRVVAITALFFARAIGTMSPAVWRSRRAA